MLTFSNFDRSTLKLFVAACFALGGASLATAHAQDNPNALTGVFGDPIGTPVAYGNGGDNWLVGEPIDWIADFAEPSVNTATSGDMSAESLAAHPTCVVYANGRRALIHGAALHDAQYGGGAAVALQVINADGSRTLHALTAGGDGFFTYDMPVAPNVFAVRISVAEQPDAMSPCTRPNIAPAPGLGLGGVAISNSTPAAEATTNVAEAVDDYNLCVQTTDGYGRPNRNLTSVEQDNDQAIRVGQTVLLIRSRDGLSVSPADGVENDADTGADGNGENTQ